MNFIESFEEALSRYAGRTAIVDEDGSRSTGYLELDAISGRIAAKLMKLGIQPGSAVMIDLGRRMEYVAAWLGALKAGCAAVPVVPDYPRERLELIRRDSGAAITICEDFFEDLDACSPAAPVMPDEDAPAVIIYTSGSTGRPKGILHSQRALGDAVRRNALMLDGLSSIRFGATAPMSFVAFILEYLAVLSRGGCVHILDDATRRDMRRMEAYFERQAVNAAFISPRMLSLYRGSRGMERVLAASEVLRNAFSDDYAIYNVYGMSETLGAALFFPVDRAYDNTPIGRPVAGVEVFLLDEDGREVTGGAEGEICLKGCFADGYLHLPSDAFERQADGAVLFHTGDIGRRDESGNLVYVERRDWMVKINGQRVETGEIEARLSACAGVTAAAVRAFDDPMGQKYLAAYYTAEGDVSPAALTAALRRELPDYMVPRYYRRLERMPVNANGKLDRRALLPPDISDYKSAYAAPENERQAALCRAMEKLLQCGTVGIDDDFFSLGGDSIRVLALIAEAGLEALTPDLVLRGRTARGICALLDTADAAPPIAHQAALEESYPLTDAQLGVYLQCVESPGSMMYNIPMCCALPKGTDLPRFASAVCRALENHRALGVKIGLGPDGEPRMIPTDFKAEVPHKTASRLEDEISAFLRPFDLGHEPLFRAEVVSAGGADYLLFDIHHLVFDGSSVKALMADIARACDGTPLPEETLTLFDISAHEKTLKESAPYREAQAFFENLLSGLDTDSRPVSDITDPSPAKGAGRITLPLGDALTIAQAERFARERGITEGTLFLGAFAYALAKFNGAEDALFCTVDSGRHDPRLDGAVGMFVKTLPFYLRMDEAEAVSAYLRRVQDLLFEEIRHDCISFGELARRHGVRADISFVYQAELLHGAFEARPLATGDTQFDLTVMVHKNPDGYELAVDFRTELYSDGMMRSFADMLAKVIPEMAAAERLGDIALASPSALSTLDGFNRTDAPYDARATVVDLFRAQAKRFPDHPAVVFENETYTYGALDKLTDTLAKNLRACGVEREKVVAVLIPRCASIVIASLGALKAGGAYLPLDPSYPPERLNLMVRDSGAMLLITTPELSGIITDDFTGRRIMLNEIARMTDDGAALVDPSPDDLFIMLYTSGTTGVPKGVMLTHANLSTFCAWHRRTFGMDESARVAAYASYGFDACMLDLYPTLTTGGTVYIVPEEMRLDLNAMRQYYGDCGITHAFMTTQVGRQFALMGNPGSLRLLSMGGEKLTPFAPGDIPAANVYGPTECTILSTFYRITHLERDVPIGRALDNMRLYVVDRLGRRLPVGAAGELLIAGPQVARGYLNRPEQTAAAFTKNPFTDEPKYSRVYHTGDIVRFMADGNVQFIGRRDAQVKVRGFRIELTEVEEVIRRFPGIKDAAMAAYDNPAGGKYIAAYVVSDQKIDVDALNAFIRSEKPPYMVPAVTMQLDAIPYNQNQKVNRRALPMPRRKVKDAAPPRTGTQQAIFDIVAEVLGHRDFGVNTDLYEAGLTSIASLRLNVRLSEKFGVPVRTSDLKENDTVEKLERFFQGQAAVEDFEVLPDYALTKTQEGIFVESIARPESTIYNVPLLLEISDSIDFDRLKTAIVDAVDAHPYIKTRLFMNDDGDVRQRRMDGDSFTENEIEILRAERLEDIMDDLVKPFKLLGGRLFRVRLIQAQRRYVLIEMHHIISDGTSLGILLNDIDRAYRGEKPEKETFSGYEVVLNEARQRKGEALERARDHYARLLEGVDTDSLPVGDIRDFRPDGVGEASLISQRVTQADAERFCSENQCGLNAFFTAVFGLVLSRFNGVQTSAFAGIYNGRNDSRLARTVSMLVKTLPIVADTADERAIGEYVSAMNRQLLDSMASDIYSFAEIDREYGFKADVMFIYQGDQMEPDRFCGEPARLVPLNLDTVKAPLCVFVYLKDGQVRWASQYSAGLYSEALIEGLLEALDQAARECLARETLREVSILTERAGKQIEGFNETDNPYDDTQSVVDPILEQAKKTPERTAVVYKDARYTYAQLDRLTDRLAQHLTRAGIGPETVTAVLIPRCEYMVICSLGVLRAGGAYLPLDPTYPPERLNLMVKDSGARLLIATPELSGLITDDFTGPRIMTTEIADMEDLGIRPTLPKPENLFIMLYTSGSTGTPKGVMLEHRNVLAYFIWYIRRTGIDENTHASSYASYGFDACMQDLYPALMRGGCVYIIPDDMRLDLNRLRMYFCENDMTHAFITTQIGRQFALMERVPSMKLLIMGGEKLVPFAPPDYLVMNGYGPSECAMGSTMYPLTVLEKDVPIGRPVDNLKVYVVDPRGHMLPPGAIGELWISGPQVSRGYLNRPEQTERVYTKNPFCDDARHARVYHTGDMVRWLPDGNLQFIGRRDGLVKIRGFRIELTEVEEVIRRFPGVEDATVAAFDDNAGGKYMAAYLVSAEKLDTEALKQFILSEKPPYMVPAVMMQIDHIPYTQNQKVNRRALPLPERRTSGREPANETEARLCQWFAAALGMQKVYADDDFFDLGGTSISAAKIAMKCATENLPVVYKDIFDYSTPHRLSQFVLSQSGQKPEDAPKPEESDAAAGHEPLWEVLKHNTPAEVDDIRYSDIGTVLVTGATGFLGIHVVKALLDRGAKKIYCLLRRGDSATVEHRMMTTLMYYFDNPFRELIGSRIIVIEGDILDGGLFDKLKDIPFDTLINCAASVKHFTNDDSLDRINFHGVENLIDLCLKLDKKLIQTSTVSVAGTSAMTPPPVMREDMLSFGQRLDNKYIHSKWLAERAVLTAVQEKGLRAKVIRLGNLMSREADGEFQMNFETNGFMKQLRSFAALGCFRVSMLDMKVEYSPIDFTAKAVLLLSGTPDQFTVFHANNCHAVHMANVLQAMAGQGIHIDIVNDGEFQSAFGRAMQDEQRNMAVSSLISYNTHDPSQRLVEYDNAFTVKALYRLGFGWPLVSVDYIRRSIQALVQLAFFD